MHVCHAIYRLGFDDYLQPLAANFGYTTIKKNFDLKKWSRQDEVLLLFAEAGIQWLQSTNLQFQICKISNLYLGKLLVRLQNASFDEILHELRQNQTVCVQNLSYT